MLNLYSPRRADRIIASLDRQIHAVCLQNKLPAACLQAILYQEITQIDLIDPIADLLVFLNHWRLRCAEALGLRTRSGRGLLWKLDSSTGYAQIFARTGMMSLRFALDRGLADDALSREYRERRPDPASREDLFRIWLRLRRDRLFNLKLASLTLLSAAEERVGSLAFSTFSPEQYKLVFTRYNGTFRGVSPYGEQCWCHYLRFSGNTDDDP